MRKLGRPTADVLIICCALCLSHSGSGTVALAQEIMLDGATVSAAFDSTMDMGIVGTTAGTVWYIDWSDSSSVRLVSGHKTKVPMRALIIQTCCNKTTASVALGCDQ